MFKELGPKILLGTGRALAGCVLWIAIASGAHAQVPPSDQWLAQPVDDRTFAGYLQFLEYNPDVPFETHILGQDTLNGIVVEHLTFQSTPGERVTARLYHPEAAQSTGRAVVLLHGGTGQGKDSQWPRHVATLLARAGWTALAIDMKHFGERDTGLLRTFTTQDKNEALYGPPSTYLAWVQQTVKDVGRSLDFLVAERGLDGRRVALIGFSRGAVVGSIVGGADERFAMVALIHGGHQSTNRTAPHLPAACPANYIARINPRPLFMINAEVDAFFPKETSVIPLQRLVGEPSEFRWSTGRHGVLAEADYAVLLEWLRENVP